ncbi:MAG: molybdopterin synthase sulfur carrier subunit [Flavobacteriales bacterium CG_4_9_14_0_2_um_filter_35_242]|nr:MoaD/ThiS family protein [Zetaproteobacteria bacterium]NDK18305.1 MoaD/ThiS family protein [Flavobacteriales bacterium]OIO12875.1 MAG: hypothetical protein AUJ53_01110 [Flavobacteriaceae bacterium CG1_02_35_72]PIR14242.1 MAG: molybdopterin synthase sulfur carrier subunit [Flavobacteriales bacterium CG11_big_fil_rev_8_21_14_0_20_35_7]PIX06998.1 MAG: molybdopterin synthase sulfur carrier subunit [Flavobacteriales bacterium CG_4_8_14_3_um_filter_35_10]PJC58517.1 MAG: molybdopterin synthase sul
MIVKLLVFGIFTDIFGANQVDFELPTPINVGQLKAFIAKKFPQTEALNFAIAVDETYADDDLIINENQIIALIPPVSGG